jgi:hypothetical protein
VDDFVVHRKHEHILKETLQQHRDKLGMGQNESEAAGIVLPDPAAQPELGETFPAALEKELMPLFAGLRFFHGKAA